MSDGGLESRLPELERKALAALRERVTPTAPADLAELFGEPENRLKRALGSLVGKKLAKRAGGGRYTPAKQRA